ncbi:CpsD/CapB family tyrosine-protein kinase [Rubellimicrobium roseum]|uniref:CpsD/CapB family tyrosine-protein kinase n=1 Tax=Rubellimicrobium roseum TaxID=687525 RepID=A0A5C4NP09_9RHOB|nr:CpsD/CapB family tyrosine-protein kinase [Rubellimicrobium roseum]TNC74796.1 CpsD/CapB family tyrosine-protein kinase [Rubellimicrobium roseum]
MERIQHAIEKARIARKEAAPASEGRISPERGAAPTAAPEALQVAAHWQALREAAVAPRALVRAHIVAATGERDAVRFDMMRTKLLHEARTNGWRRIAITSPGPGCGKSTISLNLAYSLARQPERRVVLFEADLRRPSLSKTMGLRPSANSADFLEGRATLEEVALRLRPNLAVLLNPQPRRDAAELFQSPGTPEALAAMEQALEPDVVIFDMPPMLTGDDVMAFAAHVDAALIVAGAGTSSVAEIDNCERDLASRTNIMGVVVNKCRYLGKDYGYSDYG